VGWRRGSGGADRLDPAASAESWTRHAEPRLLTRRDGTVVAVSDLTDRTEDIPDSRRVQSEDIPDSGAHALEGNGFDEGAS